MSIPGPYRQEIITRVEDIRALKACNCESEGLEAEHAAITHQLQSLKDAVLSGASRAEVIEILNTLIGFCATHFADEEEFLRGQGDPHLDGHMAAHRDLLAKFVGVRRSAAGQGISMAALDCIELLRAFHGHVASWDRYASRAF